MGTLDIILMAVIIGASLYLLYHSMWKKKGHCSGCDGCECPSGAKAPMRKITIGKGEQRNEKKSCC